MIECGAFGSPCDDASPMNSALQITEAPMAADAKPYMSTPNTSEALGRNQRTRN